MYSVVSIFAVLVATAVFIDADPICHNACEHREVGYKVDKCLPCPYFYECTGNNQMEIRSCPKDQCMHSVIQRCAPSCKKGATPGCYDDAVLGMAPAAPSNGNDLAICNNACEYRATGYKVDGCLSCPQYFECTGNNQMVVRSCPKGQCMHSVTQRCALSCVNGGPAGCYDDDVKSLDQGPMLPALPACPTGPSGIMSCENMPNGDYQSCFTCHHYVTCDHGKMRGGQRACASAGTEQLVWNDDKKQCDYQSSTCSL